MDRITRHLATCPACAADAALEQALFQAAVPAKEPARADLWVRIEQATLAVPPMPAETGLVSAPDRRRARSHALLTTPARLSLGAAALLVTLLLVGRIGTDGDRHLVSRPASGGTQESGTAAPQRSARLDLLLWESQPSAADPLGPTTRGWLALLEEGS